MNMDFEGLMACQHRHKQVISTQWTKCSDRGSRGIVEHRGEGQLIQRGTKKEEKGFLEEIDHLPKWGALLLSDPKEEVLWMSRWDLACPPALSS